MGTFDMIIVNLDLGAGLIDGNSRDSTVLRIMKPIAVGIDVGDHVKRDSLAILSNVGCLEVGTGAAASASGGGAATGRRTRSARTVTRTEARLALCC